MTDFELEEMYRDLMGWTWADTVMAVALIFGALGTVMLFGFVFGIGMGLARGLF